MNKLYKELETIDFKIEEKNTVRKQLVSDIDELKIEQINAINNYKQVNNIEKNINKKQNAIVVIDEQIKSLNDKKEELCQNISSDCMEMKRK